VAGSTPNSSAPPRLKAKITTMTQSRRLSRVDRGTESTGLMFLVFFSNLLHLAASTVPARHSHDYERHGVTSLFAALDVASGVTIRNCYRRHRHQEFLRFLNDIEANLPRGLDVHLVIDNYGTHKVTKVRSWLARHPRYHVYFSQTSGSWLNLVERLFAEATERCVRRGSHTTIRSLETALLGYLDQRNKDPKHRLGGRQLPI
jgi:hypothetical protein